MGGNAYGQPDCKISAFFDDFPYIYHYPQKTQTKFTFTPCLVQLSTKHFHFLEP